MAHTLTLPLEGLLHMYTWVAPDLVLEPHLTQLLLTLIKQNGANSALALDCINEVLESAVIPTSRQEVLLALFKEMFALLQALAQSEGARVTPECAPRLRLSRAR